MTLRSSAFLEQTGKTAPAKRRLCPGRDLWVSLADGLGSGLPGVPAPWPLYGAHGVCLWVCPLLLGQRLLPVFCNPVTSRAAVSSR